MAQTDTNGRVIFEEEGRKARSWFVEWLAGGLPDGEFDSSLRINTNHLPYLSEDDRLLYLEVLARRRVMLHEQDQ